MLQLAGCNSDVYRRHMERLIQPCNSLGDQVLRLKVHFVVGLAVDLLPQSLKLPLGKAIFLEACRLLATCILGAKACGVKDLV